MTGEPDTSEFDRISSVFRDVSLRFFLEHIPVGSKVLDCGCGDGAVTIPLAKNGCEVDALDRDPVRLNHLQEVATGLRVRTHHVEVLSAQFAKNSFDYVISRQFLPHFPNWLQVLKFQVSLVKPGGGVILHHRSEDNAALCEKLALTKSKRAAVRRGYTKRHTATVGDLRKVCRQTGCVLEKISPISFFTPRAALWRISMSKADREQYRNELESRLSSPDVYDFVCWFESNILARSPAALSDGFIAILRRSSQRPSAWAQMLAWVRHPN